MTFGRRHLVERPPVDTLLLDRFQGVTSADLSNAAERIYAIRDLFPVTAVRRVLGFAFTVKVPPGENLLVLAAIELARPGEVVVVDCGGDRASAMAGDLVARQAQRRGLSGLVVDGAVRDSEVLRSLEIPIFAAARSCRGAQKIGSGEMNVPICCGGMVVSPGDLVLADRDGAIAVPRTHAPQVLEAVEGVMGNERRYSDQLGRGEFVRFRELVKARGILPGSFD